MIARILRWGVGIGCGYEAAAIFSGRFPTISEFVGNHPLAGAIVGGIAVGGLTSHFLLGGDD